MQQLEGFQYATASDLNMGYYNTRLSPSSQDIVTIVTKFEKFRYNCLPMGMCTSGDILQAKGDELSSTLACNISLEVHIPIGRRLYLNFSNLVTIFAMS